MDHSLIYNRHKEMQVKLNYDNDGFVVSGDAEKEVIASSTVPIHVFWNVLSRISQPDQWPEARRYASAGGSTAFGVFVTYQSSQQPLPLLGLRGDTWVTPNAIYINIDGNWVQWERGFSYRCPYEPLRLLAWSRNAHFKYLLPDSIKTERRRWHDKGVPFSSIPTRVRDQLPTTVAVIQKKYDDLSESDCVLLLNVHCNDLRGEDAVDLSSGLDRDWSPCAPNCEAEMPHDGAHDALDSTFGSSQDTTVLCTPSAQPTYKPFPVQRYRTPTDHHKSSGYVRCWNNMEVFLQFTKRRSKRKESPAIKTCKWILSGTDATAVPHGDDGSSAKLPIVTVLESPLPKSPASTWSECEDRIRDILSHGRLAAVTGGVIDGPMCSWDERSLSRISSRGGNGSMLQWHSALKNEDHDAQGKPFETVRGTLQDFLLAELDPLDSVNCLDIPTIGGDIPPLVCAISTSTWALSCTAALTLQSSTAKPNAPEVLNSGEGSPNVTRSKKKLTVGAGETTCERPGGRGAGGNCPAGSNTSSTADAHVIGTASQTRQKRSVKMIIRNALTRFSAYGSMHSIEWDAVLSMSWVLFSSGGAMTEPHHDASGYCTWLRADMGSKMWALVLSNASPQTLVEAMQDYHRLVTADTTELKKIAKPVVIFVSDGMKVFQPPGMIHAVYTLERSVFTCGHFYTLDSMHLTEVARACAVYTEQCGTNASHPGSTRLLSRIALSLVYNWQKSVLRKPFISLARMLLWAYIYRLGDVDPYQPLRFEPTQESEAELAAAQAVVEAVLEHNDIFLDDIRPEPLASFKWISSIGEGSDWTDWTDPGTVRLTIPDMREYFEEFI